MGDSLSMGLDQSWKTEQFRFEAVQKLTQAFQESQRGSNRTLGNGTQAEELEKSICKKAESQRQYLELLEKCINVVRRMGQQQQQQQQQMPQQPQLQQLQQQQPQQQSLFNSSGGGIVTSIESRQRSTNVEMVGDHRHVSMGMIGQQSEVSSLSKIDYSFHDKNYELMCGVSKGNNPSAFSNLRRFSLV